MLTLHVDEGLFFGTRSDPIHRREKTIVKACKPILFRSVGTVKLVVLTAFDAFVAKEHKARSHGELNTTITSCGVEIESYESTMGEFNDTVVRRAIGACWWQNLTLLATALDCQLYVRFSLESVLFGERQAGSDWRSRCRISGIMVTDAKPLYDHLRKTESMTSNHDRSDGGERFGGKHRGEIEVGSYHTHVGGHLDEGYADE